MTLTQARSSAAAPPARRPGRIAAAGDSATPVASAARPAAGPRLPCWLTDSRGAELVVRQLLPADEAAIRDLHDRCSEQTLCWRYFGVSNQVEHLLTWVFDQGQGRALGAFAHGRLVALANLMHADATGVGEVAFLVSDAWQNRGLGSQLVDLVTDLGREDGSSSLHADVTLDNGRMRTLFARRGWSGAIVDGDYCMDLRLR